MKVIPMSYPMSELSIDFEKKLNIKVEKGTHYYSQSNSICERSLRTIQSSIYKLVEITGQEWDIYLPFIAYNYITSNIESLQSTPFELMYYRKPPSCLDLFLKKFYTILLETNSTHYEIMEKTNMARQIASENHHQHCLNINSKTNKNIPKIKSYRQGKEIYLKNKNKALKFDINYIEPVKVIEDLGTKVKYLSQANRKLIASKSNVRS
ncbi:Ribonuclease H-like domain-containing protein [Strongyloides ratti]|uniref:Ribonuclease H-like domain-containing protein n=1 Tax=Strongyloides ratti TaxID=34506 RepID=A0A090L076_STRRB|nr:Ribonuclease H-like domain-containing protein [Strongyloides ratti]CEF61537.1 Ribonuclease H-like domain-containing protein [Strongyloides ratti]